MRKIIFVGSEFFIGGVESSFCSLVKYGFGPDDSIELHLLDQPHPVPMDLPEDLKVVNVDTRIGEIFSGSIRHSFFSMIASRGLRCTAKRALYSAALRFGKNRMELLADDLFPDPKVHECDVCFVLKENEPTLYYALTRVKSRQTICFFHTADFLSPDYVDLYQSKAVDKIVTVSQGNRDFLRGRMPKAWDKISVIHNIVPQEEIRSKALGSGAAEIGRDTFHIVSVCRVDTEKGVDTVLEAAKLLDEAGFDFRWHIIGPFDKGYTEDYWLNESRAHGTEDRIVFEGARSDPYPYIKAADLLVNASRVESFGMAIREAQILGTPVISTDTYGGRELIDDGITGILVPIGDPAALAAEIGRLMGDPDALHDLALKLENTDFDETEKIRDGFAALMEREEGNGEKRRILIVIGAPVINMGSQALARGLVKNVKEAYPDSYVTVAATDKDFDPRLGLPDVDRYLQRYAVTSDKMDWVRIVNGIGWRLLGEKFDTARYRIYHLLKAAKRSDLVLIIGGDNYDRSYNSLEYMWELNRFLEEIGPQKTVLCNCSVSKEDLSKEALADISRFRYITARDSISFKNLKEALPDHDIRFYPDVAFCLDKEPVALPEGWEPGNMIGINVSSLIGDGRYGISEEMVLRSYEKMIDDIIRHTSLKICFIPHVKNDADLSVLRRLDAYVSNRTRAILIDREDYNAVQKKYIISNCRLFVGARTHATIAAYSSMVPTLVVGYSVKSIGIAADLFGTEGGLVVPISKFHDPEYLAAAFRRFLAREPEIRARLEECIPPYIEAAKGVQSLIKEILANDR